METKPLLYGLIGFFLGGFIVSVAALTFEKPATQTSDVSMNSMTEDLRSKSGDDYDKAFITHMIAHHESALDMAKLSQVQAKHQEIKKLSEEIVRNQAAEIEQLKQWQTDWGYAATGDESHGAH